MKKIAMLIICFLLAGGTTALAEIELPRHSYDLGMEISYIKYEEPDVMEEKGAMYGITGSYIFRNTLNKIMLSAEGKASWGKVDYQNSGTIDNIDDYMLEARGLAGYDFSVLEATMLTPYIGIGCRYLNDDLSGRISSTGASGYERESNYYYSPIGVDIIRELDDKRSIGLRLEYDYFWKGIQKSHLSDVSPPFSDLENDQNKGYGARGAIRYQQKGEAVDQILELFVRYWNIKKSENDDIAYAGVLWGYGYEPKNNSTEIGARIAVKF